MISEYNRKKNGNSEDKEDDKQSAEGTEDEEFQNWEAIIKKGGVFGRICNGEKIYSNLVYIHLPIEAYMELNTKDEFWDIVVMNTAAVLLHDFCERKKGDRKIYFHQVVLTEEVKTMPEDLGDIEVFYCIRYISNPRHFVLLKIRKQDKKIDLFHHQSIKDVAQQILTIAKETLKELKLEGNVVKKRLRRSQKKPANSYELEETTDKISTDDDNFCAPYAWIQGIRELEQELELKEKTSWWGSLGDPANEISTRTLGTIVLGKAISKLDSNHVETEDGRNWEGQGKVELSKWSDDDWFTKLTS